jgi:site-specific DNA recombinase
LKSANDEETSDAADDHLLSIPWQKPPSRKSRQILVPHGIPRSEVRPTRVERRARLVNAIVRGRRWLDEVVSGSVTDIKQIAARQKCSARQVNMTISLAFLAPDLVRAAVEGRLPRGSGVERLRDAPAEWSQQFEALGLKPQLLRPGSKRRFFDLRLPMFPGCRTVMAVETLARGTEFLDAETGG